MIFICMNNIGNPALGRVVSGVDGSRLRYLCPTNLSERTPPRNPRASSAVTPKNGKKQVKIVLDAEHRQKLEKITSKTGKAAVALFREWIDEIFEKYHLA
jgi:hypothetical protein